MECAVPLSGSVGSSTIAERLMSVESIFFFIHAFTETYTEEATSSNLVKPTTNSEARGLCFKASLLVTTMCPPLCPPKM
jgi:hypothetical protein